MRVVTTVYGLIFALMVFLAVLSLLGVFTDPYVNPGM